MGTGQATKIIINARRDNPCNKGLEIKRTTNFKKLGCPLMLSLCVKQDYSTQ